MKTRLVLSTLAASLGLALMALPASAVAPDPHLTQAQIDGLHSEESRGDVINALGAPQNITRWMDGSRSMVYQTYDSLEGLQHVYVDLDKSDKVTAVEVLNDYDN